MLLWTPHFSVLDSTFFVLDSTFWLDSTLKIDPGGGYLLFLFHFIGNDVLVQFDCYQCKLVNKACVYRSVEVYRIHR